MKFKLLPPFFISKCHQNEIIKKFINVFITRYDLQNNSCFLKDKFHIYLEGIEIVHKIIVLLQA